MRIVPRFPSCYQSLRRTAARAVLAGSLLVPLAAPAQDATPHAGSAPTPTFYACLPVAWFGDFLPVADTITVYSDCLLGGSDPATGTTTTPCKTLVGVIDPRTAIPPVFQQLSLTPADPAQPDPPTTPEPMPPTTTPQTAR